MTTIMNHRIRALEDLDALGPMPTLPRHGPLNRRHPDADAWEQQAVAIGQTFFAGVWQDAKRGSHVCRGFVQTSLFPLASVYDNPAITDAMVSDYSAKITPRWTESLRAMEG
jgi:hypothetical protein